MRRAAAARRSTASRSASRRSRWRGSRSALLARDAPPVLAPTTRRPRRRASRTSAPTPATRAGASSSRSGSIRPRDALNARLAARLGRDPRAASRAVTLGAPRMLERAARGRRPDDAARARLVRWALRRRARARPRDPRPLHVPRFRRRPRRARYHRAMRALALLVLAACSSDPPVRLAFTADPGPAGSEKYLCFGFDAALLQRRKDIGGLVARAARRGRSRCTMSRSTRRLSDFLRRVGRNARRCPSDATSLHVWALGNGDLRCSTS